jgi:hypothetical protein
MAGLLSQPFRVDGIVSLAGSHVPAQATGVLRPGATRRWPIDHRTPRAPSIRRPASRRPMMAGKLPASLVPASERERHRSSAATVTHVKRSRTLVIGRVIGRARENFLYVFKAALRAARAADATASPTLPLALPLRRTQAPVGWREKRESPTGRQPRNATHPQTCIPRPRLSPMHEAPARSLSASAGTRQGRLRRPFGRTLD